MRCLTNPIFLYVFPGFLLASCVSEFSPAPINESIPELVEAFGVRLQAVSLLSSDVAEAMTREYSGFVSPDLLDEWISDLNQIPGRVVSSP